MRETQGPAGNWLFRTYRRSGCLLAALCAVCGLGAGCLTTVSSEPEVDPIAKAASVRNVGLDYVRQGQYAMAIRTLQDAQRQNPSDPLTYYGLGEAFRSKGLLPEAEANLMLSLANSPSPQELDYQTATLTLAAVYIQMERYPEAEALCQILIDDPTYGTPWIALTNRGWAEYKSGRFLEAQDSYEEALDFRSDYAPAHFNLGKLDQSQSRWLSAIRQLELASESKQMSPRAQAEAHFRMGEIYTTLGRQDKAVEQFRNAEEKAPQDKWGIESRNYLDMLL
jgi:type IV pilus assembly protein PilF